MTLFIENKEGETQAVYNIICRHSSLKVDKNGDLKVTLRSKGKVWSGFLKLKEK